MVFLLGFNILIGVWYLNSLILELWDMIEEILVV